MASSLPPASLRRIRQELKEWEHTFHRLHGRSPSKDDIKASPSIHDLYKQYACLKLKLQAQSSKHTENCKPSIDSRKKTSLQGLENPDSLVWARPSSPATKSSCSDGSQGTHISATPPRKKAFICTPGDVSSRDAQTGAHNLSLCSLEVCRPALCEIASNSAVSKNNHEGKDLPGVLFQASSRSVACKNLNSVGENTTAKQTFSEETCKLGFTIKLQRYGERNKENLEVENIPAGFCLNPVSSFRHAAKPLSRRILARQPDTGSADTASFVDMQVTATELQALEKSSHAHLCDQKKASFALSDSANNMNVSDAVSSRLPIYEGDSDKNKIIRDTEALDLLKLTVPSLRRLALDQGLPSSGSKSELISHLTQTSSEAGCVGNMTERKDQSNSTSNWSKNLSVGGALCQEGLEEMTVAALRKLLTSKGLHACGNKAALVSRLLQNTTSSTDSRKPRGVLELPTGTCKRKSEYEEEACTGNEGILGRSDLLHRQLQGSETLQSHSGQKLGRKSAFQNNHSESFASKKSKATVELINWHSVHKSDCLIKKSGVRQNFVKLNIGKRGNKSHRFVNTALKRKLGAGKRRFKSYSKRKLKKSLAANMEDDIECYGEDGSAYDLDGNLLEQASSPGLNVNSPQAHLTHSAAMGDVQQADSSGNTLAHGNWDCASASLTLAAAEALESPTEENLHKVLHLLFGYKSFRPGQLETIQQILAGQSTMVVLPTGAGKSLSYQLPAFLLPGLTLVISPLVAVMVDQLQHLPPVLSGAFLSSIQTSREYCSILNRLHLGQLKVLFVSPERLICDKFLSLLEGLPRISLAVVDEAHCLSEWSHNFRPSYYRLGVILRQKLNLNCVLAMTATATKRTLESIMQSLSIAPNNLVQGSSVRRNLICTASWSENRCKDLLSVLRSSPFRDARSIIVYCNFQFEADNVSLVLRDNGIDAKSYHGGMSPTDRKRTQELFCNNKLRVVVATVAFGLGLDKSDVNAVIHYGLPNSVEHYVQETGRAGRNGDPAHCHLLLDNTNYLKLRSLAFSDNVDVPAISSLLSKIFSETSLQSMSCQIQSIPIESTTKDLDLKEEVMATTLSYLEVGDIQYVSVLPQLKTTCTLQFHKNSPTLLARNSLLIDAVMKMSREKHGEYSFELPSVANYMGLKLPDLQQQLQDLQVAGEVSFTLKSPAFCFHVLKVPEDLSALELKITECFAKVEHLKVKKLDFMFQTASKLAIKEGTTSASQSSLQEMVQLYFQSEEECMACEPPNIVKHSSSFLKADIKVFLQNNSATSFTSSRSIARIFHGISSPAFPSSLWSRNHFWGRYKNIDFNTIKEAVSRELAAFQGLKSKGVVPV